VTRPRCRQAIGLGLLLPGLLLVHPGAADAATRTAVPAPKNPGHKPPAAKKAQPKAHPVAERKIRPEPARAAVGRTVHVVRARETLTRIAAHYGVTRKALIDANKLTHPEQLRAGQRLVVPSARMAAGDRPVRLIDAVLANGDILLVRAGPRRVPTRFYMAEPGFDKLSVEFAWPVEGQVVSPFGRRRLGWHAGMDIKAEIGAPILAAAGGTVISSGQERAYGHVIRIEHEDGFVTLYAHNLENLVEVGDRVSAGTIIGTVGRSGRVTGPHLHFEIRHDGMVYNPLRLLPARETTEVRVDEAPDMPNESARVHPVDNDEDE
jgi:murein DD-endopeptidase MepM/ murein hydrolase activator NlpD